MIVCLAQCHARSEGVVIAMRGLETALPCIEVWHRHGTGPWQNAPNEKQHRLLWVESLQSSPPPPPHPCKQVCACPACMPCSVRAGLARFRQVECRLMHQQGSHMATVAVPGGISTVAERRQGGLSWVLGVHAAALYRCRRCHAVFVWQSTGSVRGSSMCSQRLPHLWFLDVHQRVCCHATFRHAS